MEIVDDYNIDWEIGYIIVNTFKQLNAFPLVSDQKFSPETQDFLRAQQFSPSLAHGLTRFWQWGFVIDKHYAKSVTGL